VLVINKSRDVRIAIPIDTARLLCQRAEERWHSRVSVVDGGRRTVVQVWPPRNTRMGVGFTPLGSFTVQWGAPLPSQASITHIEWDQEHGGSEEAIRQAINSLVGWPIANDSGRTAA
jgi:hypothetical protein